MSAENHLRAGEPSGVSHLLQSQAHQVGQEQEQSPAACGEAPRGEIERARVGRRLHGVKGGEKPDQRAEQNTATAAVGVRWSEGVGMRPGAVSAGNEGRA